MSDNDRPQLCLITPAEIDLETFSDALSSVLDAVETACLRISLSTRDEDRIARAADAVRLVAHERDIPAVIETHVQIAERHGLDGVHLNDGARSIRTARKALGPDAIVGSYCGNTRHEGINAGEAGADYVAFGPVGSVTLGTDGAAEHELFEWWSAMIEVPVIAEGGLTLGLVESLAPVTDFFAFGDEIWNSEDPAQAARALFAPIL
ncbi:thiamine phosphate synthase [Defluviimonas sp. WL0002]|uniref:Thiamine phosphate synthase n=1 Tax=Albidovulum marisflavi TaxID=2984159 RepID=A0ABT2ZHC5_9RHOB|nr:thiamine phosphate synthase [Defluviimonas sp. WL0002]MCV2870427.1 thiamine phosphate synthase [Defluviimonas sp. WL0002]